MAETILDVQRLKKHFPITKGLIRERLVGTVKAVDDVSFSIGKGETLGLAGETGCGKTTVLRCIARLLEPTEGDILFEGHSIVHLSSQQSLARVRRRMQLIFQDPYGSLDPRMTAGQIIAEPLTVHKTHTGNGREEAVREALKSVGLEPSMINRYPHMFSGGQRQRISIARALVMRPELILCDEPVSALDVSIQAQIINLILDLREQYNHSYLFVAHDLSLLQHVSDRVVIMYLGKIVEIAPKRELFYHPIHPYTQALISAVPIPDPAADSARQRIMLSGEPPSPINPPSGCLFHPRCQQSKSLCGDALPELRDYGSGHWAACHAE